MVEGICCGADGSNSLLGDAGAFISSCIAIVGEEGNIINEKGAIGASFKSCLDVGFASMSTVFIVGAFDMFSSNVGKPAGAIEEAGARIGAEGADGPSSLSRVDVISVSASFGVGTSGSSPSIVGKAAAG
jgi:hypothetical protein